MTYYDEEDKPLTEKERSEIAMKVSFLGKKMCIWLRRFCRFSVKPSNIDRPVFNSAKGNLFI